jgi:hypothetical protein
MLCLAGDWVALLLLVMHPLPLTNVGMEYCSSELFDKAAAPRNDSKINQSFKNI